ncbi:MAG: CHASE4 domain-containing protein [Dehalococcoidales bacterium]|nr:CHASE4 domain-containing protein [Dehalococcoidales bacterium]
MSLRTKAILITFITLALLIAALYGTSRVILLSGISEIEKHDTEGSIQGTISYLSQVISRLEGDTAMLAVSDDAYAFIEDANDDYVRINLTDSTFNHLGLNLMVFVDAGGQVIFSKAFDLDSQKEVPVSPRWLDESSRTLLLGHDSRVTGGTSGIILLDGSPMMVAAEPILKSDATGPSRGLLIFGRYLDSAELSSYAQLPPSDVSIRIISGGLESDFREALESLTAEKPIFTSVLSARSAAAYTLINDIHGSPLLVLRIVVPRDAYLLGQTTIAYHIITVAAIGLVMGVAVVFIVQKQMLSRFTILVQGINHIASGGGTSARLSMSGKDELNLVASTINAMLGALEKSATEIWESEERYRDLFENTTDLIQSATPEGRLLHVNEAWCETLGYKADDLNNITLWNVVHPDYQAQFKDIWQKVMGGEPAANVQAVFIARGGKLLTVEGNMDCWFKDGKATAIRGIFHDITEREHARERLQKLYEQEKTLRKQLEEEIRKRVEFTRALVHELKTPITPVLAAVDLLLEEVQGERLTRLVQSINRSASHLNQRIDELLDIARGETNMLWLDLKPVKTLPLLRDIGYEVTALAQRNHQTLNVELPASLPVISADEARLRQVVINLLNNAMKYTGAGGKITLRAREDSTNIIVEVEDTGQGIGEEEQESLFQPYYRRIGDTEHLGGLGLGLFLARKFVELHGGRLWVKSLPGIGSTFSFSLPIKPVVDKELRVSQGRR